MTLDPAAPIGVFDSGVGGLTVLHELLVALPNENFIYLGDTARFPYGERTIEDLRTFAIEIANELSEQGAKLIVSACNSATAAALHLLQELYSQGEIPVRTIGVISPESHEAVVATRNGRVGVLATLTTAKSDAYKTQLKSADPYLEVTTVACHDLARIIQEDVSFDSDIVELVRSYCLPLKAADVDTVILGCTHYPLVRPLLHRILGKNIKIISPGQAIARRVECALGGQNMLNFHQKEGNYRFLCTADPESFRTVGTRFLQMPLTEVQLVTLEKTNPVALTLS